MMATDRSKAGLRSYFKDLRSKLNSEEAERAGKLCVRHFKRLKCGVQWLLYAPIQNEISTRALFDFALSRGDKVFLPRLSSQELHFHSLEDWNELKTEGPIPQPSSYAKRWDPDALSVAVVPGLCFDALGGRVGFGKAYYDRFLSAHPAVVRLALAYDFQIVSRIEALENFDARMDYIICPSGVWGSARVQT